MREYICVENPLGQVASRCTDLEEDPGSCRLQGGDLTVGGDV